MMRPLICIKRIGGFLLIAPAVVFVILTMGPYGQQPVEFGIERERKNAILPTATSYFPSPTVVPQTPPAAVSKEALENKTTSKPSLYALSLSFMDQMSWAAARLKSLQCWATTWKPLYNISVVEPFVINGSRLGVPICNVTPLPLKFSDIFDTDTWNSEGKRKNMRYPELVSWSNFLNYAPRNVVAVQIVYERDYRCTENEFTEPTCGSVRLNKTLSEVLAPYNFTLIHQVCINFRTHGALSVKDFNHCIFDPIPELTPVTVVFDEWRGPGDKEKKNNNVNQCFIRIKEAVCSPNCPSGYVKDLTKNILTPSSKIEHQAKSYISQYLRDSTGFVAVLIRWEKLLLSKFYNRHHWPSTGAKCLTKISSRVKSMCLKNDVNTVFLTADIGKFGSSTFHLNNITRDSTANVTSCTEDLLREFHNNNSMSLLDYDQRFVDIAGTTNPAYISQLQKAIAANARCLVLVGWGTFHESALQMYKRLHPKEDDRCRRDIILSC